MRSIYTHHMARWFVSDPSGTRREFIQAVLNSYDVQDQSKREENARMEMFIAEVDF